MMTNDDREEAAAAAAAATTAVSTRASMTTGTTQMHHIYRGRTNFAPPPHLTLIDVAFLEDGRENIYRVRVETDEVVGGDKIRYIEGPYKDDVYPFNAWADKWRLSGDSDLQWRDADSDYLHANHPAVLSVNVGDILELYAMDKKDEKLIDVKVREVLAKDENAAGRSRKIVAESGEAYDLYENKWRLKGDKLYHNWRDQDLESDDDETDEETTLAITLNLSSRRAPSPFIHSTGKDRHETHPIWVMPDGKIFLESFSKFYVSVCEFLVAIAEPRSRPDHIHEWKLTENSLYGAAATGLAANEILDKLQMLSKARELPDSVVDMIERCTKNYGQTKLVLHQGKYSIESPDPALLHELREIHYIRHARVGALDAPYDVRTIRRKGISNFAGIDSIEKELIASSGSSTTTSVESILAMEENAIGDDDDDDDDGNGDNNADADGAGVEKTRWKRIFT